MGTELAKEVENRVCNVILCPAWHKLKKHIRIVEELYKDSLNENESLKERLDTALTFVPKQIINEESGS